MDINPLIIIIAGAVLLNIIVSGLSDNILRQLNRLGKSGRIDSAEERIDKLATSLKEAMELIATTEQEVKEQQALAESLQKQIETNKIALEASKPQVEALAQILSTPVKIESRRAFRQSVGIATISFILGAIVSFLASWIFSR